MSQMKDLPAIFFLGFIVTNNDTEHLYQLSTHFLCFGPLWNGFATALLSQNLSYHNIIQPFLRLPMQ